MQLNQVASWINRTLKQKLAPDQIVLIMDAVQRLGFDEDLLAFQVWSETLTILTQLNVSAFTVAPVAGDVGRKVRGTTSLNEGTLRYFENSSTRKILAVELDDEDDPFTDGEAFTIVSGTGTGTLESSDASENYKGPYDFPEDESGNPLVRKFMGITTVTDPLIFGTEVLAATEIDDYGFLPPGLDPTNFYTPVRADEVGQTFEFVSTPSKEEAYRWVYWREAPPITGVDSANEANFLIPARYHFGFINACVKCGNMLLKGESFTREDVKADLGPWWDSLRRKYTPNGKDRGALNAGQNPRILI